MRTTRVDTREVEASKGIRNLPDTPEPRAGHRRYFCGMHRGDGVCGRPATVSYRNTKYAYCEACWDTWCERRLAQWRRIEHLYAEVQLLHCTIQEQENNNNGNEG